MTNIKIIRRAGVDQKFGTYPKSIKTKLNYLRELIIQTAIELDGIEEIEESLKWGEPSYKVKKGSTIRIDWKEKMPNEYAMYFSCQTQLVPTFRILYGNTFRYEKNRAIIFEMSHEIPELALKDCIALALSYHSLKHLPLLGK